MKKKKRKGDFSIKTMVKRFFLFVRRSVTIQILIAICGLYIAYKSLDLQFLNIKGHHPLVYAGVHKLSVYKQLSKVNEEYRPIVHTLIEFTNRGGTLTSIMEVVFKIKFVNIDPTLRSIRVNHGETPKDEQHERKESLLVDLQPGQTKKCYFTFEMQPGIDLNHANDFKWKIANINSIKSLIDNIQIEIYDGQFNAFIWTDINKHIVASDFVVRIKDPACGVDYDSAVCWLNPQYYSIGLKITVESTDFVTSLFDWQKEKPKLK